MPAAAAAAITAQLVVERRKHPITPFSVVMQSFDIHLLLRREPVMRGHFDIFIDLFKTIPAQAVKIGLCQESIRFGSQLYRMALAIRNIPHFANKGLLAFRAIFFFVLIHHSKK
jgi:hypothetical protein